MTTKAEMRDQPKRHSAAPAALALSGAVNTGRSVTAWFRPRVEPSVSPAYLAHWKKGSGLRRRERGLPAARRPPISPRRSRLRHFPAGSPTTPGRIGFVILRTTSTPNRCSPPRLAATQLRPASGLSVNQEGNSTPQIVCARRRTGRDLPVSICGRGL